MNLVLQQRLKEERHKEYIQYLEQLKTDRETAGADTKDSRGAHGAMPSGHEEHRVRSLLHCSVYTTGAENAQLESDNVAGSMTPSQ